MKAKTFRIIAFTCAALLLALLIAMSVVIGILDPALTLTFSGAELDAATRAAGEALATQIEEEGIVLVQNNEENGVPTLPLSKDDVTKGDEQRVNVFGWASTDWIIGGSGSGRTVNPDGTTANSANHKAETDLLKALAEYTVFSDNGIKTNANLTKLYTDFKNGRSADSRDTLHSFDYQSCMLYEPDISAYTADVKQQAEGYSNVALVVLGRIAGESNDAPKKQYKYNAATVENKSYLDISKEEEDMLTYVGESYDKVIVIINSTNTMNLEFMKRIPGLDACLIAGCTGVNAANAIPNILFGQKKVAKTDEEGKEIKDENGNVEYDIVKVSPSGRTVDTYAYDFKTNASYAYSGMDGINQFTGTNKNLYPIGTANKNVKGDPDYTDVSYLDYYEGIYVGYRWYETADAEGFWNDVNNQYGQKYNGVVQYPFGYGKSYTTFDWDVVGGWKVDNGKISVEVRVTNTGDYPAQEVVQLYYTPPYTPGGIEKAAVNLAAFAKTPVAVEPGKNMVLTLSFDIQDMASYDESANEGKGQYVLEKGNYALSLRTDAHTVAKVKSGDATHNYNPGKNVPYTQYAGTNGTEQIHNLFGANGSDGVAIDGSSVGYDIQWLSRQNFKTTYQETKAANRAWKTELNATNKYTSNTAKEWDNKWKEDNGSFDFNGGAGNYTLSTGITNDGKKTKEWAFTNDIYFFGNPKNYESEEWDLLLGQIKQSEMEKLVLHGYIKESEITSIGKPETSSLDGPSQIGSFNSNEPGVGYPMGTVIAQTWNAETAKSFGLAVGTEALGTGRDGWYAPGINLHRSAFGGRNYEYYSEDPLLSGVMCANTVRGALNAGVYTYIKHLIGYDQESMRDSLYCWMTEQALREIYLKPFKIAIDAGATGLMSSYGRLGAVWSGGSRALLTDLLRNEWGFKGTVITDYSDHQDFMNGDQMLRAGGDLWMDGYGWTGKWQYGQTNTDAFKYQLQEATKHIIYTWANAAYEAQQYQTTDDAIPITRSNAKVFKWWWIVVAAVDVLCAAGAGVLIFFGIKKKDKPAKDAAPAGGSPADGTPTPSNEQSTTEQTMSEQPTAEVVEQTASNETTTTEQPAVENDEQAVAAETPAEEPAEAPAEEAKPKTTAKKTTTSKSGTTAKKSTTGTKSTSTAKKTTTGTKSTSTAKKTSTGTKSGTTAKKSTGTKSSTTTKTNK